MGMGDYKELVRIGAIIGRFYHYNRPIIGQNRPIMGQNRPIMGQNRPIMGQNRRVGMGLNCTYLLGQRARCWRRSSRPVGYCAQCPWPDARL